MDSSAITKQQKESDNASRNYF